MFHFDIMIARWRAEHDVLLLEQKITADFAERKIGHYLRIGMSGEMVLASGRCFILLDK